MTGYTHTTLGALCDQGGGDIQTGPFGSQLHASDYVTLGIPSVMPENIGDNVINPAGIAQITPADADRLKKYRLRAGDIVYSRRGDVEKRALVRAGQDGWVCGTGCLRVRLGESAVADPVFVSYALGLEESRRWVVSHAVGATMPNLNTSILSALPIALPDLRTQRAIAEVLGALDDKIVANASAVRTARGLARALFLSIPTSRRRAETVGSILVLEYGRSLPSTSRKPGPVEVFGSGGLTGYHNSTWLPSRGVIVGRKGTVGAVYWAHGDYLPIDTTFYVVPKLGVSLIYCYHALSEIDLASANSDSAVPGLNRNEAYALPVLVPDESSMSATSDAASALFDAVAGMEHENRLLAGLRDTLLPHLMSGKLRVRDAEKQIEAVI